MQRAISLFVKKLPPGCTAEHLTATLNKCGVVDNVKMLTNRRALVDLKSGSALLQEMVAAASLESIGLECFVGINTSAGGSASQTDARQLERFVCSLCQDEFKSRQKLSAHELDCAVHQNVPLCAAHVHDGAAPEIPQIEQLGGKEQGDKWQSRMRGQSGNGTNPKRKRHALEVSDGKCVRYAGDALCWQALSHQPCVCAGAKLHLSDCATMIKHLLGQRRTPCTNEECTDLHPEVEALKQRLMQWWGRDWHWVDSEGERKPPAAQEIQSVPLPVPPPSSDVGLCLYQTAAFWQDEVATKHPTNQYLTQMTQQTWFAQMLAAPGGVQTWRGNRRTLLKELTESFAVVERVRAHLSDGSDGSDATLFDICSGKGLAALMLSYALPGSKVVMVDADTRMGLNHLYAPMLSGQLKFYNIDIFTPKLPKLVQQHTTDGRVSILIGTHLCGSLSPRLISVYQDCAEVDALVLSPCCLKGWLGKQVQKRAKEDGKEHYHVLCEELSGMVRFEASQLYDAQVLSPKNGYILSTKPKIVGV